MMQLWFRIEQADRRTVILVSVFAIVFILGPLIYWTWYAQFGGAEREKRKTLESLRLRDPEADARKAIDDGDFRLFTTGEPFNSRVPGFGSPDGKYRNRFGYRFCPIYTDEDLTPDQLELDQAALRYFSSYNRIVFQFVCQQFPHWRDE